jgi:glycosyltransferase involved in cell wall biosynthesis
VVAERFDEAVKAAARTLKADAAMKAAPPDLLIYHHSIYWKQGEDLLKALKTLPVLKYHNVTPPEFFAQYSTDYVNLCRAGRDQTRRLIELLGADGVYMADSPYNAAELYDAGAAEVGVAPPFTNVANFLRRSAADLPAPPYSLLFVGRMAPHKGHFDLLTVTAAYAAAFGRDVRLTMVGGMDDFLEDYGDQIRRQTARLGIADLVTVVDSIDDKTLVRLFAEADIFLCMSEHEGFCVPIIEAQAAGIPVVSVNTTALGDTIGLGQLVVDPPRARADYLHIAELIHAACTDDALRAQLVRAGQRNVLNRFNPPTIADRFVDALTPALERLA